MLNFSVTSGAPEQQDCDCVIVGIYTDKQCSPAAKQLDTATGGQIQALLDEGEITGKLGETLLLHHLNAVTAKRVLLVGLGAADEWNLAKLIKATVAATKAVAQRAVGDAVSYLGQTAIADVPQGRVIRQSIIAASDALYRFDQLKTGDKTPPVALKTLQWVVGEDTDNQQTETACQQGTAIASGMQLTRDLANLPANYCTPNHLAERAEQLAAQYPHLQAEILDEEQMQALNMNALLSVARGSTEPARLIVLNHQGSDKDAQPVVLVGKGVTFDSGGISLKPGADMDQMKFDMGGAAATIGTMAAIAAMNLPLNVIAIVPTVENMPDGSALKPGDVITSMSGQTIEVLNTDAEGRLILCDALTYAERYNPAAVVDMATLTGACIVGLGRVPSAVLGNDAPLIDALRQAGEQSCDRLWELPLWDEYQEQLDSNFADMANIGGREGGTITAAAFLSRFTKNYPWAHLDIAGTAWKVGKEKGATGRPVPALTEFFINRVGLE